MSRDSIWHCFAIPRTYGWNRPLTLKSYVLFVYESIQLRRRERRYARIHDINEDV